MYCKHCGKQIADDSKFCQHCGGSQDAQPTLNIQQETEVNREEKNVEIPTIKTNFSDATKWWIFGCGIWFVVNMYWLFAGDKSSSASEYFQPFSEKMGSCYSYYDFSEFIVYVFGLPFLVWGVVMLIKKLNSDSNECLSPKSQHPLLDYNNSNKKTNINDALGLK